MTKKVKVSKINIKVNKNTEIELSLEEAKELQKLLNDTFGTSERVITVPSAPAIIPYPVFPRPWRRYWEVTWDSNGTGASNVEIGTVTYSLSKSTA